MDNLTWWREMGQKIKDIIRSRNTHTHTHAACLCPYMGRFIPEAWRASALTILFYAQLVFALCGTLYFRCTCQGASLGNTQDNGKDSDGLL